MTFSISVHVDGYYGLTKGVPNLLKLFDEYNIKATFFINMGREASLFQLFRYWRGNSINVSDMKVISRYSKRQMLEMLFMNRALGHKHPKLLKEIKRRGHEVNPHCWSHLLWSKNFDKIDKEGQLLKMKEAYYNIFKRNPKGFAPPTWKFDKNVIVSLKKQGFEYLATSGPATGMTTKNGLKIIPLSFSKNIEELLNEGMSEREILELYRRELNKKYVNLYFHSDFEGLGGIKLFEEVLKLVKNKKTTLYSDL